jgi:circadian clock protein KaiC
MLNNCGYYRGSSILVSGTAGTGKTSLAVSLVDAACRRGERCLYVAFEESTAQIIRNMRSIGIDLEPWVNQGILQFRTARPTFFGIEMHLLTLQKMVEDFKPNVMVIDPLNNLISIGSNTEVKSMLVRLIDYLKKKQITTFFTSLASGDAERNPEMGISSLMDTWLMVRNLESNGERNRALYILKSRGMAHSSQVREFCLTDKGIDLVDVYVSPEGVLTGSARVAQESRKRMAAQQRQTEIEHLKADLERKRQILHNQVAALQAEFAAEEEQLKLALVQDDEMQTHQIEEREKIYRARQPLPHSIAPSDNGGSQEEK